MKKRRILILGSVVLLIGAIAFVSGHALAGPTVHVGRPCSDVKRPSVQQIDHGAFDALLQKYVDRRGMVAYTSWKTNAKDLQALDTYLAQLGCVRASASRLPSHPGCRFGLTHTTP